MASATRGTRGSRVETVHEDHESDEQSLDWWPKPRHVGKALAWSARVDKPTDNKAQGSDAGRAYYLAMARSIRGPPSRGGGRARRRIRVRHNQRQQQAKRVGKDHATRAAPDSRPVRGVATRWPTCARNRHYSKAPVAHGKCQVCVAGRQPRHAVGADVAEALPAPAGAAAWRCCSHSRAWP